MTTDQPGQLLTGLRVLEIGAGSTGASIAGMLMADAGARVLKVEPPAGDRFRRTHPSGFVIWNRGKESLVLDLRERAGRDRYLELARGCDVVLDGFAPTRADAWCIGEHRLRAANPEIVYTAITGFGPTGDYARLKSYEALVASKIGFYSRGMYAYREGPIYYPVPWGGFGGAMHAVAGTLAALRARTATGLGQRVDVAMVAALDAYDFYGTPTWQLAVRRGEGAPEDILGVTGASRFAIMPCTRDGKFMQTPTMLAYQAQALTRVAGLGSMIDDPRYADMPRFPDPALAQSWEDAVCEAFRQHDAAHWIERLTADGDVPFEVAITSEEALDQPQFLHNGDVVVVDDPELGAIHQVGPIGHFRDTPCVIDRSAPALGAHDELWPAEVRSSPAGGEAPEHPLSGVTVVEFGAFYAMPYAIGLLAGMGARVIKIEDAQGDPARQAFGEEVLSFKTMPGKESLSLDLRDERAQNAVRAILATADVFVTGYRPGVVEKMGLGYADLRKLNKKLIFVQATGYGADGPNAARALYGPAASAIAGAYGRQAGYWSRPEQNAGMSLPEIQAIVHPRLAIIQDGDANGALGLMAAISLALHHQSVTGKGQFLLTSMIASNAWAYADDFCRYEDKPAAPIADPDYLGLGALHRVYPTADGWVCLHVDTDEERRGLAAALGLALPDSGRGERETVDGTLAAELERRLACGSAQYWEATMLEHGVPCVAVFPGGQSAFTSTDAVLRATGLTVEVDHPVHGRMVRAAPPVQFSGHGVRLGAYCLRGDGNDAILAEVGIDRTTRDQWVADRILFPPDPIEHAS